jgi:hypothetical protein
MKFITNKLAHVNNAPYVCSVIQLKQLWHASTTNDKSRSTHTSSPD